MNNSNEPLYLSAGEAAAELSISPATLYAYVSRGLVRSEPTGQGTRGRRYRAEDVRSLKNRRAPLVEGQGLKAADLPVMDTTVSTITEDGPVYRGVNATTLADSATFEQTAGLLWDAKTSDPFAKGNLPYISPAMQKIIAATDLAPPIDHAIAVLSLATDADPTAYNNTSEGRALTGARILRLVAAVMLQTAPRSAPIHEQIVQAWALNNSHARELIRRALVLLADHELNASTFAVRCAASTGISLYDAVIAGLVALKGPRHGGVGPQASRLLDTLLAGDIAAIVRERVALGERFPGFGHMIRAPCRCSMLSCAPESTSGSRWRFRIASAKRRALSPIAIMRWPSCAARSTCLSGAKRRSLRWPARRAGLRMRANNSKAKNSSVRGRAMSVRPRWSGNKRARSCEA
jgi:citrate synthase